MKRVRQVLADATMAAQHAQLRRDRLTEKHAVIISTVTPTATADQASMGHIMQPSVCVPAVNHHCTYYDTPDLRNTAHVCRQIATLNPAWCTLQACAALHRQIAEVQAAIGAAEADLAIVKAALRETLAVNAAKDAELR